MPPLPACGYDKKAHGSGINVSPNHFCDDCGAPVQTETVEVRSPEKPAEALIVTMGRCVVCERQMSFGG